MRILFLLHGLTLIVLFLILWGLDRLVLRLHRLHEYIRSVAEFDDVASPAPATSSPPHAVKCLVHGCGWPAVQEGYCEDHFTTR